MPVYRLGKQTVFPPVHNAQDGLLAFGGDLSTERLLESYRSGVFPWYSEGDPILWWAPPERMVLPPEQVHVSRRLQRTQKTRPVSVKADQRFGEVIQHCATVARKNEESTWIHPEMIEAYRSLYELGYAHSIEVYREEELVGGLYGVSLGGVFFGESMFSLERDASKFAFIALARQCERWGFILIDCQMWTGHLESMGAKLVSRELFMKILPLGMRIQTRPGPWQMDADISALDGSILS